MVCGDHGAHGDVESDANRRCGDAGWPSLAGSYPHGLAVPLVDAGDQLDSQHAIQELQRLRMEAAGYLALTSDSFWGKDPYQAFRKYVEARYHRVSEARAYLVFDMRGVKANGATVT